METISVRVKPGAKKRGVRIVVDEKNRKLYVVSVKSLPKENAANEELIDVLADYFNTAKSNIALKRGFKSRNKVVSIEIKSK